MKLYLAAIKELIGKKKEASNLSTDPVSEILLSTMSDESKLNLFIQELISKDSTEFIKFKEELINLNAINEVLLSKVNSVESLFDNNLVLVGGTSLIVLFFFINKEKSIMELLSPNSKGFNFELWPEDMLGGEIEVSDYPYINIINFLHKMSIDYQNSKTTS